ncbi:MAG: endolytic transglycosylase MltG [Cardiobacteriaceae bacterium]|nr:endolytic transglycosylase MltG [Cardiobacteriaceae bacterium]
MKRFLLKIFLLFSLLALTLAGMAVYHYQSALQQPVLMEEAKIFEVKRGRGVWQLAEDLVQQGILPEPYSFTVHAILQKKHHKIQAGVYEIKPETKLPDLLDKFATGKVVVYQFTLIEGKTVAEMLEALHAHPALQTQSALTPNQIAQALNLPEDALEGWFAPNTYQFSHGQSALDLVQRMHQAQKQALDKAWQKRSPNLPLQSPYEALILASIIEKETGVESERAQVAGVFVRRLQKNMKLQTDPTVIYGAIQNGSYQGKLTKALLQTDTPYNTYTRLGLPPTPIANPSLLSLEAAMNPAEGSALFFMAKKDGGHTFSDTYEQHQQAVKAYYQSE